MRTAIALSIAFSAFSALSLAAGCQKAEQPAAQATYPTQAPGAVNTQPAPASADGDSPPTPAFAPSPVVAVAPLSNTAAPLSQPNALALPCTTDAQCLTHRCNVAAGKCAWPCQSDNDCVPGNACVAPTCLPKLQ
jgi:CyaY protein